MPHPGGSLPQRPHRDGRGPLHRLRRSPSSFRGGPRGVASLPFGGGSVQRKKAAATFVTAALTVDKPMQQGIDAQGGFMKGDGNPPSCYNPCKIRKPFLILRSVCRHFVDTLSGGHFRDRRFCVGIVLSSRSVARQVFSPPTSLTSVFGMGTGGPSPS